MTSIDPLNGVLLGAFAMGCFVVALFFLRFWYRGRDVFFLLFALSFLVEGGNRFAQALSAHPGDADPERYLIRLLAFSLILIAVLAKNGVFRKRR